MILCYSVLTKYFMNITDNNISLLYFVSFPKKREVEIWTTLSVPKYTAFWTRTMKNTEKLKGCANLMAYMKKRKIKRKRIRWVRRRKWGNNQKNLLLSATLMLVIVQKSTQSKKIRFLSHDLFLSMEIFWLFSKRYELWHDFYIILYYFLFFPYFSILLF